MARYVLDIKHNGHLGDILTMCLVRDDNVVMYVGFKEAQEIPLDAFVLEKVVPVINSSPIEPTWMAKEVVQDSLRVFFSGDTDIVIVTDWPEDVAYFSRLLLTQSNMMIATPEEIPRITFKVERINAYPTEIGSAIRYNAYWDAMALRHKLDYPNGIN